MLYSKNNTITGHFGRYGVFSMRLPVCSFENTRAKYFGLRYFKMMYGEPINILYLDSGISFIGNETGTDKTSYIMFDGEGDVTKQKSAEIKLIVPIIESDILPDFMNQLLVYDLANESLAVLKHKQLFPLDYKKSFNYKIECLGEYEWKEG